MQILDKGRDSRYSTAGDGRAAGADSLVWADVENQSSRKLRMDYAVEFAKEHKIKYSYLMVIDSLTG